MMAATMNSTPPITDSRPPATRGIRMVLNRPTARSRTEGMATRAMNKKTMGSTAVSSAPIP